MSSVDAVGRARDRDHALRRSFVGSGVTRLATLAFSIAALAVASRGLDVQRFGVFSVIYSTSLIAAMADFGVGSGLVSTLSRAHGNESASAMRRYVASAAVLLTCSGAALTLSYTVISAFVEPSTLLGVTKIPDGELGAALWAGVACLSVTLPLSLGQRVDIALQRGAEAMLWMMAGAAITFVGCLISFEVGADLWVWVVALLGGPALSFLAQSTSVLRRWEHGRRPRLSDAGRDATFELIRVAGLYFVIGLTAVVAFQSGVLIVSYLEGAVAAGILGLTVRLFGVVTTTLTVSTRQFWPAASEAFASGQADWVRTRFKQTLLVAGALGAAGSLTLVLVGRPLIRAWAGPELVPSWTLLGLAAAVSVYAVTMTQLSYLLNAANVIKPQVWISLASTAATVPLSWWLTETIGTTGPYLGLLLTNLVLAFVPLIVLSRRVLNGRLAQ